MLQGVALHLIGQVLRQARREAGVGFQVVAGHGVASLGGTSPNGMVIPCPGGEPHATPSWYLFPPRILVTIGRRRHKPWQAWPCSSSLNMLAKGLPCIPERASKTLLPEGNRLTATSRETL